MLIPSSVQAGITGQARVIDGDTIQISKERIRLHGIDAPEMKQTCTADGKEWTCGKEAFLALSKAIGSSWITCKGTERDKYKRLVAVCYLRNHDLNAMMVREGWALAYRRFSTDYVDEEAVAKEGKAGMWRGVFTPPWEWRRK